MHPNVSLLSTLPAARSCRRVCGMQYAVFTIILFLTYSPLITAQTVIDTYITDAEKKVLKLNLPANYNGRKITVTWYKSTGEYYNVGLKAKGGDHLYEMRTIPSWSGDIASVLISDNFTRDDFDGAVTKPSVAEEFEIFLRPMELELSTINGVSGHGATLFGMPWNRSLTIVFVTASVIFLIFLKPRRIVLSVLLGFVVAWSLMDLRSMYDHWQIAEQKKSRNYIINKGFQNIKDYVDSTAAQVTNRSWTTDDSWGSFGVYHHILHYGLAEHKYIPNDTETGADYIFSIKNGRLSFRELVK